MNDYTKVVIETDDRGRMSIGVEGDDGYGHGYRLAGQKYCGCHAGKSLVRAELDKWDVAEIRSYLRIWDEIQARMSS